MIHLDSLYPSNLLTAIAIYVDWKINQMHYEEVTSL